MNYEMCFERAKKVAERLYDAVCSIYVYEDISDGNITKKQRCLYLKDIPCRIVYKGFPHTEEATFAAKLNCTVKLIMSSEVDFPEGCDVEVTLKGVTHSFSMTGYTAKYVTHQETELRLEKRWA